MNPFIVSSGMIWLFNVPLDQSDHGCTTIPEMWAYCDRMNKVQWETLHTRHSEAMVREMSPSSRQRIIDILNRP